MTTPNDDNPSTVTISVPGTTQVIIDVLQSQYGNLDSGEARAKLETLTSDVWSTDEFNQLFDTLNTHAPYVDVVRKQDGVSGTVMFIDSPRLYFSFNAGNADNDNRPA